MRKGRKGMGMKEAFFPVLNKHNFSRWRVVGLIKLTSAHDFTSHDFKTFQNLSKTFLPLLLILNHCTKVQLKRLSSLDFLLPVPARSRWPRLVAQSLRTWFRASRAFQQTERSLTSFWATREQLFLLSLRPLQLEAILSRQRDGMLEGSAQWSIQTSSSIPNECQK